MREFDPDPGSVRAVRRYVAGVLSDRSEAQDVVLAASELASNVVRHAHTPFTVRVVTRPTVRLEVRDGSAVTAPLEKPGGWSRGLRVVEGISEDWGVEPSGTGKMVWVEFSNSSGG